MANKLVVR